MEMSGIERARLEPQIGVPPAPNKKAHGDLLNKDYLLAIGYLDGPETEAFGTLYHEAAVFEDHDFKNWLDLQFTVALSRRGFRSNQIVDAIKAQGIHVTSLEAAMRQQPAKEERPSLLPRGLGGKQ